MLATLKGKSHSCPSRKDAVILVNAECRAYNEILAVSNTHAIARLVFWKIVCAVRYSKLR
jgi:hypothetical protein